MPSSGGINDQLVALAVDNGELDESLLDQVIARNVALSLLGKDLSQNKQEADLDANHDLARHVAAECTVLLKNEDQTLPLDSSQSIALIGAFAEQPRYQGTGSSQVKPTTLDNSLDRFKQVADRVEYARGYDPKSCLVWWV